MRGLTLALLLALLPGCAIDNPLFGLGGPGSGGSSTAGGSEATAASGSSGEPVASSGSGEPTGTGTGTSGPGTSEAGQTSTVETSEGTGVEPQPTCEPTIDAIFDPHVFVDDLLVADCQDQAVRTFSGKLEINNGAMTMDINAACGPGEEGVTVTLGKGYPLADKFTGCATATITWDKTGGDCAIGLLGVGDTMTEKIYYVGNFNNYPALPEVPLKVMKTQATHCGCPDAVPGCCGPLDAGDLLLVPAGGGPIAPQQHGPVALADDTLFEFYNIESYVDGQCKWHVDWIAAYAS